MNFKSDRQRKAIFWSLRNRMSDGPETVSYAPITVGSDSTAISVPKVSNPTAMVVSVGEKVASDVVAKKEKKMEDDLSKAVATSVEMFTPVSQIAEGIISSSDVGEPHMLTNSEFMTMPEDYNAFWSKGCDDKSYIDIDNVRKLVKKEYPRADVDADIRLLPPGDYTQFALNENPGREVEAATSNGFYSPVHDAAYLEKDPNKLNTLRAMIHELAHDMSDDGVNDDGCKKKYMLNEGYADYVAKRIMTDELKIPEKVVNKTIGYPEEVAAVECLVKSNGRKKVDDAFLVDHSLKDLKTTECKV